MAYHQAGLAVAMWKLGFGIAKTSVDEPTEPTSWTPPTTKSGTMGVMKSRGVVDETAIMADVEDNRFVTIAWCHYLWQRAYAWMSWTPNWILVVALARVLRKHRTLHGASAEEYLHLIENALDTESSTNDALQDDPVGEASPWHRERLRTRPRGARDGRPTTLPDCVRAAAVKAEMALRPIAERLELSTRAATCLAQAGIRTVQQLAGRSERELASIRGMGPKTLREVVEAARRIGIELASYSPPRWL